MVRLVVDLMNSGPKIVNGSAVIITEEGITVLDAENNERITFAHNMGKVLGIGIGKEPITKKDIECQTHAVITDPKVPFDKFMVDLFRIASQQT